MKLAVFADENQWNEIRNNVVDVLWIRLHSLTNIPLNIDALFILSDVFELDYKTIQVPIFINEVTKTLKELNSTGNVLRINGWKGFLARSDWEVSGTISEKIREIFQVLNKKFVVVPDEPGFISARILAMIINEAWFAFGEKVSTKNDIDIAMKLGTNYPFGPFEWGAKIGEKIIYDLLLKLSATNKKYLPAPLLKQKIIE